MVDGEQRAQPVGGDIGALLGWWKLAGADVLVAETPRSWFEAPDAPTATQTAAPTISSTRPKLPARPAIDPYAHITALDELRAMVAAELPNAPFADGNPASGLMIMGESPSADDLKTGRPFTGPAGQMLDRMLAAIGLDRSGCYISLVAPRRRIPGTPPPEAVDADLPLALAHIRLAAPRLLLLMGGTATHALSGETAAISKLRGRWLDVDGGAGPIPALATFNPAYLLRRPEDKRLAWADLLAFRKRAFP